MKLRYPHCTRAIFECFRDRHNKGLYKFTFFAVKCSTDDGVDMSVGFTELCQDDQIKLIKQGSFEVILARYVPLFTDDGMFVPDMSAKVPRSITIHTDILT